MKMKMKQKNNHLATLRLSGEFLKSPDNYRKGAKARMARINSFVVLRDSFVFFVVKNKMVLLSK